MFRSRKGIILLVVLAMAFAFVQTIGVAEATEQRAAISSVIYPTGSGYWMLDNAGNVYSFGDAQDYGGVTEVVRPSDPAIHLEPTPTGNGYWVLTADGTVWAMGYAKLLGTVVHDVQGGAYIHLPSGAAQPIVLQPGEQVISLSATPTGKGYWLFTSRGQVFALGDAEFFGDMSKVVLNGPVVGSVATPTGKGYYMVASDGGIFAFGDARFYGSMGDKRLNAPVESLVPTADNAGYWLVASDGGIFAFGDAAFRGSMGSTKLNKPVVGMVRFGNGYLMVGADGGIFSFSDKGFFGSLGNNPPASPVSSVASFDQSD